MVSYIIPAANYGKDVIRVVSDETDVFILLVYWVHRATLQCKVQMERWNGTVLEVFATTWCACSQWVQYNLLSLWQRQDKSTQHFVIWELSRLSRCHWWDKHFISQFDAGSNPHFHCFVQSSSRNVHGGSKIHYPKVMALPPTSANLLQHALCAHLQIMQWRAADQQAPPAVTATITDFGWEVKNDIPVHWWPSPTWTCWCD